MNDGCVKCEIYPLLKQFGLSGAFEKSLKEICLFCFLLSTDVTGVTVVKD